MSIERGNTMLLEEITTEFGDDPDIGTVINYLMSCGVIASNDARAYIARQRFRRAWTDACGKRPMMDVCREIAQTLDVNPISVYRQAVKTIRQ